MYITYERAIIFKRHELIVLSLLTSISLSFWVRASTQNYFNVVTKNDSFYSPRAKSESRIVFSIRENILMYMLSISIRVLLQHKS